MVMEAITSIIVNESIEMQMLCDANVLDTAQVWLLYLVLLLTGVVTCPAS